MDHDRRPDEIGGDRKAGSTSPSRRSATPAPEAKSVLGVTVRTARTALPETSAAAPSSAENTRATRKNKTGRRRAGQKGTSGGLNLAQVVRSGERTPGGWGAENYRSLHRTEPSEATVGRSPRNVAPQGPKKGEIMELTGPKNAPYLPVKRSRCLAKLRTCHRSLGKRS